MMLHFEQKYVAFLDVLGFKNLVAGNRTDKLQLYFDIVQKAFDVIGDDKPLLEKYSISDSIILIAQDSEADLRNLLTAIRTLQCYLACEDIWVRGGVSFGEVYNNKQANIVVGKGYISAYNLEGLASVPRVIIDPSLLKKLNVDRNEFYALFNGNSIDQKVQPKLIHNHRTSNGKYYVADDAIFVCYANKVLRDIMTKDLGRNMEHFESLYNAIRNNLYGPQEYYAKYIWLRNYFLETLWDLYYLFNVQGEAESAWLNKALSRFDEL